MKIKINGVLLTDKQYRGMPHFSWRKNEGPSYITPIYRNPNEIITVCKDVEIQLVFENDSSTKEISNYFEINEGKEERLNRVVQEIYAYDCSYCFILNIE